MCMRHIAICGLPRSTFSDVISWHNGPHSSKLVICVVLLLCCSMYCLYLCCSMYCLCVNVCCTTATGCQHNCSWQIYHISYHKRNVFWRKKLLNTKCVFWFSLQFLSEIFLILRRTERDMIRNIYRSSCKVPVIIVRFEWNFTFLERFSKNTQISDVMKIRPVEADGHDGARSRFSHFWKRA
jgi:hypothetical protein